MQSPDEQQGDTLPSQAFVQNPDEQLEDIFPSQAFVQNLAEQQEDILPSQAFVQSPDKQQGDTLRSQAFGQSLDKQQGDTLPSEAFMQDLAVQMGVVRHRRRRRIRPPKGPVQQIYKLVQEIQVDQQAQRAQPPRAQPPQVCTRPPEVCPQPLRIEHRAQVHCEDRSSIPYIGENIAHANPPASRYDQRSGVIHDTKGCASGMASGVHAFGYDINTPAMGEASAAIALSLPEGQAPILENIRQPDGQAQRGAQTTIEMEIDPSASFYAQMSGVIHDTQGCTSGMASGVHPFGLDSNTKAMGGASAAIALSLPEGQAHMLENIHQPDSQAQRRPPTTIDLVIEKLQRSQDFSDDQYSQLHRHLVWLQSNYERAEGHSVASATLYSQYCAHCFEEKVRPVNASSFGKIFHSLFPGIRSRRIGKRGFSRYHYAGIRVKSDSPLNNTMGQRHWEALRRVHSYSTSRQRPAASSTPKCTPAPEPSFDLKAVMEDKAQYQKFLEDLTDRCPQFQPLQLGNENPDNITPEEVSAFQSLYKEHCEALLNLIFNLQFALVENLWQTFWRVTPTDIAKGSAQTERSSLTEMEARLPLKRLIAICKMKEVIKWMTSCDNHIYQTIVDILFPDVLKDVPALLTQTIRHFSKRLESWLRNSMNAIPDKMVESKMASLCAFEQALRRLTSLNHLAQATHLVLQTPAHINQMSSDLDYVDFVHVQNQATWVCHCDTATIKQTIDDFKATLKQQCTLEQWGEWLNNLVEKVLTPFKDKKRFSKIARHFLLQWSYYSSMVARDLTLRGASSFGTFHLLRLLFDEYIFYLVLQKVASIKQKTPISLMEKFKKRVENLVAALIPKESSVSGVEQPIHQDAAVQPIHQGRESKIIRLSSFDRILTITKPKTPDDPATLISITENPNSDNSGLLFTDIIITENPTEENSATGIPTDVIKNIADDPIADDPIADDLTVKDIMAEILIADDLNADGLIADGLIADSLIANDPITDNPIADDPITDNPITDNPIADDPITDNPIADNPIADNLIANDPIADNLIADNLIADNLIADDPITDNPIADNLIVDDLIPDGLTVDDLIAEILVADDLFNDSLISDGPITDDPVAKNPADDESMDIDTPDNVV